MVIVMCCTNNWNHYMLVDIYALLSTNDVKKLYLFFEGDAPKELENIKEMFDTEIIPIDYTNIFYKFIDKNCPNLNTIFSNATIVRLFLTKVIDEEKILYLDTDAIVIDDISELWNTNMDDYYIAGVKDEHLLNFIDYIDVMGIPEDSINAGITLMNLKKIKEDGLDDTFIYEVNNVKYRFIDQDILNKFCCEKILFIDNQYNSSPVCGFSNHPKIVHYTFEKSDWIKRHPNNHYWYDWEEKYKEEFNID